MKRTSTALLLSFVLQACVNYAPSPQIPHSPSTQPSEALYQQHQLSYHKGLAPSWTQGTTTAAELPQYPVGGVSHLFLRYPESGATFKKYSRRYSAALSLTSLAVGALLVAPSFAFIEGDGVGAVTASFLGTSLALDVAAALVLVRSYRLYAPMTNQYNEGLRRELGLSEAPQDAPSAAPDTNPSAP